MKKFIKRIIRALVIVICISSIYYISDYYHASDNALNIIQTYESIEDNDKYTIYKPEHIKAGFIFYPGGKVESASYAPLLKKCAENDILCVVVKMPLHLAVFNINGANNVLDMYKEVEDWYIGGHSLGGAMAASYLEDNHELYKGLILLGSYSSSDLSDTVLKVLSLYGSNDQVLNKDKYELNKSYLPNLKEVCIEGANHAQFGDYGKQDGDGNAVITSLEQIDITVKEIIEFIK